MVLKAGASGWIARPCNSRVALLIACLSLAGAGLAQETPDDEPAESPAQQLPDIVVTAQKVAQSIDEVAGSVSSIDGDKIRDIGAFGFKDLENYTANVSISLAASAGTFAVRGLATPDFNVASDPSVGVVVDGVYYGRSHFLTAFFHDIDRFEVLRGPQGTLFGKNSTAGLFNISTEAVLPETLAQVDLLYGDHGQRSIRPVAQFGFGEHWAVRLSGNQSQSDGRLYNTALQRFEINPGQQSARVSVRYDPGSRWSLLVSGFESRQRMNNDIFQFSHVTPDILELARSYDDQVEADSGNFLNSANFPAQEDVRLRGSSVTANWDLSGWLSRGELQLTSISAWAEALRLARDIDGDFSPIPFIKVTLTEPSPATQLTQEFRFSLSLDDLFGYGQGFEAVFGAYLGRSGLRSFDRFELEDLGAAGAYVIAAEGGGSGNAAGQAGPVLSVLAELLGPVIGPTLGEEQAALTGLDQDGEEIALFSHFEHSFNEVFGIIGGLRVGRESKRAFAFSRAIGQLVPAIADQEDHETHLARAETDVSPKFGFKWRSAANVNWYATWARGFKSGGYNAIPLTDNNLEFEPERATSFEFGSKARLLDGSMRFSMALFTSKFDELQVSTFQNNRFVILNAAEARSRGFELDLNWLTPLPGAAIFASVGLADARYIRYPNAPAFADAEEATQDLAGQRLPLTPRWTASLIPSFTLPVPMIAANAVLALDVNYRGARYLDIDLDPRTELPAATELNLRLAFKSYALPLEFSLMGKNLTGVKKYDQILDQPLAPGNFAAFRTDDGRYLGASLSYSFRS